MEAAIGDDVIVSVAVLLLDGERAAVPVGTSGPAVEPVKACGACIAVLLTDAGEVEAIEEDVGLATSSILRIEGRPGFESTGGGCSGAGLPGAAPVGLQKRPLRERGSSASDWDSEKR